MTTTMATMRMITIMTTTKTDLREELAIEAATNL